MLKKTVNYEDFDGNASVDTLYFNLSKSELADHLDLEERFQTIFTNFSGEPRELSIPEIETVLQLVKDMMRYSYGIKSADGKSFRKSDEIWNDFTQTAAYDALLFSLFSDPEDAVNFMLGIMPKDLIQEAQKQVETTSLPETPSPYTPPLEKAPQEMSREELLEAFKQRNQQ